MGIGKGGVCFQHQLAPSFVWRMSDIQLMRSNQLLPLTWLLKEASVYGYT